MSGFDNPTNRKRVVTIGDCLKLIQKSAKSNQVEPSQIAAMLEPVINLIEEMCFGADLPEKEEAPSPAPIKSPGHRTPPYIQIREAAETASLKDLTTAMAVFLNRIDEELN